MYASPMKFTQVRRGVRMQKKKKKKNATEVTVRVWHLTLRSGAMIAGAGATHVLTVCSCQKGSSHKFAIFFCKCNAFLRVGKAQHDRFE